MILSKNEIKNSELRILNYIDRICKENKLNYFLAYGTLLGAIRHNGFIPRDDDIDIWMPRNDYERFKQIVKNENLFFLEDCKTYIDCYRDYGKLIDPNIIIKETGVVHPSSGLFIDIFILDAINDDFLNKKNIKKALRMKKQFYYCNSSIKYFFCNRDIKSIIKSIYLIIIKLKYLFINKKQAIEKYTTFLKQNSGIKSSFFLCISGSPRDPIQKILFPKEWFKNTTVTFEGRKYNAPAEWDKLLTALYDNYMELPPEKQRITHGIEAEYKASIDKYKQY